MVDINDGIIYEGDVFEYGIDTKTGRKYIIKHEQKFENISEEKIKGAYAIVLFADGTTDVDIMTIAQIRKSWEQGS
ncbi:MAG: recombinase RecT, partial [Actinobacteria bacterium]|nr:recombinase RecT [Actinomycetota bacterium]